MIRVAIQGISGSYSEEAVREIFGTDAEIVECANFERTFSAIRDGDADQGVIPIENKIVGAIDSTAALMSEHDYRIHERISLPVRHVLAGTPDSKFEDLVSVRSHVVALKQCRSFLAKHHHLRQEIGADTASSVRRIVDEGYKTRAAIGSQRAAELYGANVLAENIADDKDNWTIFCLIGN